ncbi:MAG: 3-oxoacyl-ACP synthase, partial [Trichodesmium sp. St7_bin2_1]|nr:3-oxoacyl-ACP synthase [Trichodesmium sp. St7_bin2_1]
MTNIGVSIIGSGSAIPEISLDNQQLSQIVETSDEWISSRTGISKRQLVNTTESLCSLATQASR